MVIQNLIDLLTPTCSTIFEQGSLAPSARYPDRFFTFWNPASEDHKHYDNAAHGTVWTMEVNAYSTDPTDVFTMLEAARTALLAAGWKINGKGHAVASDHRTHTGRGFTAVYLETTKGA